jgi:hypothetical protein
MRLAVAVAVAALACGGRAHGHDTPTDPSDGRVPAPGDRLIRLLPDGAQIVAELDLARLRKNPVVGGVVTDALARIAVDAATAGSTPLPGKRAVPITPLTDADVVVLAAYGVGTEHADTVTLFATDKAVPGGQTIAPGVVAVAAPSWLDQLAKRAEADTHHALAVAPELAKLRDLAMPREAPGASLRVTARLPFDARVALARQTGVSIAPAELSIWGDVVDDAVIVIVANAVDPGDRAGSNATRRLGRVVRAVLGAFAHSDVVGALGVANSLYDADQKEAGTWVETTIAIGPKHLARAMERARGLLGATGSGSGSSWGLGVGWDAGSGSGSGTVP